MSNEKISAHRIAQNHIQDIVFPYLRYLKSWNIVIDTFKTKQNKTKKKNLGVLPRHWVSVPLQRPFAKHSLTWEPTNVYPVLQVNIAVAPYTVKVPILFPFGGDGRPPQEITRKKKKKKK